MSKLTFSSFTLEKRFLESFVLLANSKSSHCFSIQSILQSATLLLRFLISRLYLYFCCLSFLIFPLIAFCCSHICNTSLLIHLFFLWDFFPMTDNAISLTFLLMLARASFTSSGNSPSCSKQFL